MTTSTPIFLRLEWARSLFDQGDFTAAAKALAELVDELDAGTSATGTLDPTGTGPTDASAGATGTTSALHGTSDLRLLLARAYFGSAQLGRAEAATRRLVDESPDDGYLHLLLGRILQRQGRHDHARHHLALAEVLGDYSRPGAYGEPQQAAS